MTACSLPSAPRTRTFWTTQPDCSPGGTDCAGQECFRPGLILTVPDSCRPSCCCDNTMPEGGYCGGDPKAHPRTIVNTDWLRGLALNILGTDARHPDSECGRRPGSMNGHWSESYVGGDFGTRLRYAKTKRTIQESVAELRVEIIRSLNKLVTYGVARKVDVTLTYIGGSKAQLDAVIYTTGGETSRVGLIAKNGGANWAWQ